MWVYVDSSWFGICSVCDLGGTEGAGLSLYCRGGLGSDTIAPARPPWHQLGPSRALGFWEGSIDWGDGWSD